MKEGYLLDFINKIKEKKMKVTQVLKLLNNEDKQKLLGMLRGKK